jgi:hypothetical protein
VASSSYLVINAILSRPENVGILDSAPTHLNSFCLRCRKSVQQFSQTAQEILDGGTELRVLASEHERW